MAETWDFIAMITRWKLAKQKIRFIIITFYLHTYRLMHVAILCVAYLRTLVTTGGPLYLSLLRLRIVAR